jgi:hypothetical protein
MSFTRKTDIIRFNQFSSYEITQGVYLFCLINSKTVKTYGKGQLA